jgi:uncharacterized protein with HEPN domain
MPKRNDKLLLEDILESILKIKIYTEGIDYNNFFKDEKTKDAVVRNLEIIGEAVNNLSTEFTIKNNAIEWRKIAAFRNRLIHEYFGVNYEAVWMIINLNLFELNNYISKIVSM